MIQSCEQAIDVADWLRDEEFAEYPEGARDKTLLYCPLSPSPYHFLRSGHCYLFKRSSPRSDEQFWIEIFAHQLGTQMGITVPPAFVAYDSNEGQSGALIEWFLKIDTFNEDYIPGGDYCQSYIPNFDRKKGKQHNFETVELIFTDLCKNHPGDIHNWKIYWAKAFIFDALIGNTDRHQDNWGIIMNPIDTNMRISPVFDNGTSMGYEIPSCEFPLYDENRLERYIAKGWHHMKWMLSDNSSPRHLELPEKLVYKYPELRQVMLDCLKMVNYEIFDKMLENLVSINVLLKLTTERAAFMLKLISLRHQRLLIGLEK